MLKLKIKKGDTVQVITGSDKGKKGSVLEITKKLPLKVKVSGVCLQTHFDQKEGMLKKEGLIDYSNIKLVEKSKSASKKKATKKKAASK